MLIPAELAAGEWVLNWRMDQEESNQIWRVFPPCNIRRERGHSLVALLQGSDKTRADTRTIAVPPPAHAPCPGSSRWWLTLPTPLAGNRAPTLRSPSRRVGAERAARRAVCVMTKQCESCAALLSIFAQPMTWRCLLDQKVQELSQLYRAILIPSPQAHGANRISSPQMRITTNDDMRGSHSGRRVAP